MKKLICILVFQIIVVHSYAQIRLLEVDPVNDVVTIKNFGGSAVDISSYRFCALRFYTFLTDLNLESGSLNLSAGASVTVSGWQLSDDSDLGLYLASGAFSSSTAMVDFTQWGGSHVNDGREGVAVAKGIWTTGDFITGNAPYTYIGDGNQNELSFWQATLNSEKEIASYSFSEQTDAATIDSDNHTVAIEVMFGTDVMNLVATFTLSSGATASINSTNQESGVTSNDFSNLVTYTITAEDGTMQNWTVTVTVAPNDQADILSFSFSEQTGPATINPLNINIEVAQETIVPPWSLRLRFPKMLPLKLIWQPKPVPSPPMISPIL